MGGSKSQPQTQTTVQNNQPWSAAQPAMKKAISGAESAFDSGIGSKPFTGSTVVPFDSRTLAGFGAIEGAANNSLGSGNSFESAFDTIGQKVQNPFNIQQSQALSGLETEAGGSVGSGFDPSQSAAMAKFGDIANKPTGPGFDPSQVDAMSRFRSTATGPIGSGFDPSQQSALTNYQNTASGSDLFGANPEFESVLGRTQDDVRDRVNETASAMGRFGSGTHQGVLADSIGDVTSRMRGDEHIRQLARKDQATNNLITAGQAGYDNRYREGARADQAANNLFSAGQAGYDNRYREDARSDQATNNLFNAGQAGYDNRTREQGRFDQLRSELFNAGQVGQNNQMDAAAALPGAFQAQMAPAQALAAVGSAYEDLAGRNINDQIRLHQEEQSEPWQQAAQLNAIASGAGQFGTSTSTAQVPGTTNRFGSALGGALGGYSLFNNSPWGAVGGGLLGGLL